MDFWFAVEAYRHLPRQQRTEQARVISERYLAEGAPFAISSSGLFAHVVPSALRECGENAGGRMRTSLFEEAQQYALRNIVESDLHRFHTSKARGTGSGWKRTEQTQVIDAYLRSASKHRDESETTEDREHRSRTSREHRRRGRDTRSSRSTSVKEASTSEASDMQSSSKVSKERLTKKTSASRRTEPHGQEHAATRREMPAEREKSELSSSKKDHSSTRDDSSMKSRHRKTSSAPNDVRSSAGTAQHTGPSPSHVCTSRDGADEGDSKKEAQELPLWLHEFPVTDDGVKMLDASQRGIGSDASLFEDVVCCITSTSAFQHLNLCSNDLEDGHLGPLLAALQGNDSIRSIDLAHNSITDAGADHLLRWLDGHWVSGGSPLSYISLYGNNVTTAAETRLWKALNGHGTGPGSDASSSRQVVASSSYHSGHKKSRSVDVAATTLPINAMLCKKAKIRLGEVVQLLEAAQAIVTRLPDNLEAVVPPSSLQCPDEVLAALKCYEPSSAHHGPATQPPSAIELLHCITSTRVACLFDGMQGEVSWLPVPGEGATSSEQYMHEKNVKQLQQLEALDYHPYLCKYLFHFVAEDMLLFFTGTQGTSLEEVIRAKLATDHAGLAEDSLWVYNVVAITESIASSIQFVRSHEVMISLPTRDTVHVLFELDKKRVSKSVLGGVHTVASRLHNMATADLRFIAPELLKDIPAKNVSKADVFSIGVILWELLTLQVLRLQMRSKDSPTPTRRLRGMKRLDADGTSSDAEPSVGIMDLADESDGPGSTPRTYASLQVLAHQCTDPDPTNRPTLRDVQERLLAAGESLRSACATPRALSQLQS